MGRWNVTIDLKVPPRKVNWSKFVFLVGWRLTFITKGGSKKESKGLGGSCSGQVFGWKNLNWWAAVCKSLAPAPIGAPPMSVPHLDYQRIIERKKKAIFIWPICWILHTKFP